MLKIQTCADANLVARLGGMFCNDKQVAGFYLKRKGFSIDPATFDKTALDKLISEDKIIGMVEYYSVEDNDQEADFSTSSNKVRVKTVEGVKGFRFMFSKGSCFQNELAKLDGAAMEFIPVFVDGSALFAQMKDGKIKGFDANLFVGIRRLQTGSDVAGSTLEVDILPSGMAYWQNSSVTYTSDEFAFNEVQSIEGIKVDMTTPVNGATTISAKITNTCSGSPITGLTTPANWKLVKGGVEESVTSITEVAGTGNYTFTVGSLATGNVVELKISVLGLPVYVLDTSYFAISKSTPKTVV